MGIWEILIAVGVPTAIVSGVIGFFIRRFEMKLKEEELVRKRHEKERREFELFEVQTLLATAKLCEANAIALQKGKCNGETHAALETLQQVKKKQKDFLINKGVDFIFKEE